MTARDEMAVLFERYIIGEELGTTNYDSALRQAVADLDAIASLARDPATAPAVFRWLVEAGVLDLCLVHNGVRQRHYHPAGERGDE